MLPKEARLGEAVLIDAFPVLTKIATEEGSNDYGYANAEERAIQCGALEMQFKPGQKIMIVKVKWSTEESRKPRLGAVGQFRSCDTLSEAADRLCRPAGRTAYPHGGRAPCAGG